jgi:transposase
MQRVLGGWRCGCEHARMAKGYRTGDRDQLMLLPADMRSWLPPDHLAWFVIDVVAAMDTSAFHVNRRLGGAGRRGYDPDMLLALLVYCYAQRERSSRRIERLCLVDVAARVICANLVPDHTAIARFRADHDAAFRDFFSQVLAMCARAGMVSLGVVALDGTKVAASASRRANRGLERLRAEADRIVDEAAATDAAEDELFGDARGDELPEQWRDRNGRLERLRECIKDLDEQRGQRVADGGTAERVAKAQRRVADAEAAQQAKVDAYRAAAAAGRLGPGRPPQPVEECGVVLDARRRLAAAQAAHDAAVGKAGRSASGHELVRNPTDPDSRLMKSRDGWVQGYNAQTVATDDQVIVAAKAVNDANDVGQLVPMVDAAQAATQHAGLDEPIGTVVADGGYWSEDNVTAFEPRDHDGGDMPAVLVPPPRQATEPHARKMRQTLNSDQGKATYATRAPTIEGVFGHLKEGLGFRRFSRRGLDAADAEWQFMCAVKNLLKLHQRATPHVATG